MTDLLASIRGGLVVSCQAYPGEPMRTPGWMIAPPPTQTSEPIRTGLPYSSPRRATASSGCSAVSICTAGPNIEKLPMCTGHTSSTTQLKLK